ncbi:armadillo-type protein [Schizothecium vesticola]|uniref:Armadillo-type protein n=1 Tax=Schizothecium vesticola TaxID=314040 RepID=A0AA40F3Q7_9PEZI|nr:armadillo-type protein [Schizothecium vesticola]
MATVLSNGGAAQGLAAEQVLGRIHDALTIVHSPTSTNQSRQEAQSFLEEIKTLPTAPEHGFTLSSDRTKAPIVRHYGLSLLEHAVKHRWNEYSPDQREYLRSWVLQLCHGVSKEDPTYLRSKKAQLWAEIAKRCWADEWTDMDELLVRLWQETPVHKEFVLQILEMLSDEIFNNGEDAVVAIREGALSKACIEIFTPSAVLLEAFPNRQNGPNIRCGEEGWLARVTQLIGECLNGDLEQNEEVKACAIRGLAVLNSAVAWVLPKAIDAAECRPAACSCLAVSVLSVQKGALEVLHSMYSRSNFTNDEFIALVVPMYGDELVELFTRLFQWSVMIACLGNYLEKKFASVPPQTNVEKFLELAITVVQSQSLVVSIPVLVTWTRLLSHRSLGPAAANTPFIAKLLELCTSRLIRYENLPDDTEDPTYLLLMEDTDTIPERHAFLGNYRRYSIHIIESIAQLSLLDSLNYILGQAETTLRTLYSSGPPLSKENYSKTSMSVLRVDAQATSVESALKGYMRWKVSHPQTNEMNLQLAQNLEQQFETWCNAVLQMEFEDPLIRKRLLQLLVAFSTMVLDTNAGFMLRVLEHILMTWPASQPDFKVFNDAIKDLQSESMVELHRLATKMPDHLLDVYDQLETKVKEMIASGTLDEKRQIAYQSFLFIIIHRAARIDPGTRLSRLTAFIDPIKDSWRDESLKQGLASFDNFCQLLCLDRAQKYLAQRRFHEISDWGAVELDAEGLEIRNELEQRLLMLPLRTTKSFLTYSVEKLEKDTVTYRASCDLWRDGFPLILPELLKFLSYSHQCHDAKNWSLLPPEMRSGVGRVLTDRFWQAGISEGSKDEFYARVTGKKNTLEGFASSVRGSVRFVRETSYAILYCMTRLDLQFYGFTELPGPLANALFADAFHLSAHQAINLINLVSCFVQMDTKIMFEWAKLDQQGQVQATGDALTEEMKSESILRQLTYSAVALVSDFIDPVKTNGEEQESVEQKYPSIRKFCLMNSSIVAPLLRFCSHAIQMHDTRGCSMVLRAFRSIIPEFAASDKADSTARGVLSDGFPIPQETAREIREFISSDVLKAAISSLHDPYFVDLQKELGSTIAAILLHYGRLTKTPTDVLTSLPDIGTARATGAIDYVCSPGMNTRAQRAVVLDLLKDLKGVSISEMGKLSKSASAAKKEHRIKAAQRSKMAQQFMTTDGQNPAGKGEGVGTRVSPDLEGVAGMFDEGG